MRIAASTLFVPLIAWALAACGSSTASSAGSAGTTTNTTATGSTGASGSTSSGPGASSSGGATGSTGIGGGGDPTVIATDLTDPRGLAVDASNVYFSCFDNEGNNLGGIFKVPIGGGGPVAIASDQQPNGFGADDAYVYYVDGDSSGATFMRAAKDGSGAQMLAGPLSVGSTDFVVYGDSIYFIYDVNNDDLTNVGIAKLPAAGGTPNVIVRDPDPTDPAHAYHATDVLGVDAGGITFVTVSLGAAAGGSTIKHANLDGSGVTDVMQRDATMNYAANWFADGTLYWSQQPLDGASSWALHKIAVASGGTDTTIATIMLKDLTYLAADSSAVYVTDDGGGTAGVYKLATDGSASKIHADDVLAAGEEGSPRLLTIDSTHLYWVSGGLNAHQAELHVMAR